MKEPLDGECGKALAPQQALLDKIKEEPDNTQSLGVVDSVLYSSRLLEWPGRGVGHEHVEGTVDWRETHSVAENREPVGVVKAEPDPVEYTLWEQLPHCLPWRPSDIYVHKKTGLMVQLACCQKLLGRRAGSQNACTEIFIHHLGLPIISVIHIALQLQAGSFRALHKAAGTSAVELVDEREPGMDTGELLLQICSNSTIHIRVFRVTVKKLK
ncbi:zinc finger MYM-type protein 6 isoform X2 [Oryx dammah]|uniref:zinc finger MYM-type protein 6 isoform X2 n=1 Tax=Oryx dammah TaxID=59534 RepID=UPI001A9B4CB9|nr:zinc finger MYM-type protein 6 isoform X2 [Oryx dammah]